MCHKITVPNKKYIVFFCTTMEVEEPLKKILKRKAPKIHDDDYVDQCEFCNKEALWCENIENVKIYDIPGDLVPVVSHCFCSEAHQLAYYQFDTQRLKESDWQFSRRVFYTKSLLKTDIVERYKYLISIVENGDLVDDLVQVVLFKMLDSVIQGYMRESSVVCGLNHTVIIGGRDLLFVTGSNSNGQLGLPNYAEDMIVNEFQALKIPGIISVSCGTHNTMVVTKKSESEPSVLWATGNNTFRQLGIDSIANDDEDNIRSFVKVDDMEDVVKIVCSGNGSMALKSDNRLWVAGIGNKDRFGDVHLYTRVTPVPPSTVIDISSGGNVNSNQSTELILYEDGELGQKASTGERARSLIIPHKYLPDISIIKIAISGGIRLFVCVDGSLWMALGNTNLPDMKKAVKVKSVSNVIGISCSQRNAACVTSKGEVWTWTWKPDQDHVFIKDTALEWGGKAVTVSCGQRRTFVTTTDGSIYVKGVGDKNEMGLGVSISDTKGEWVLVQYLIPLSSSRKGKKHRKCNDCDDNAIIKTMIPVNNKILYFCAQHQ